MVKTMALSWMVFTNLRVHLQQASHTNLALITYRVPKTQIWAQKEIEYKNSSRVRYKFVTKAWSYQAFLKRSIIRIAVQTAHLTSINAAVKYQTWSLLNWRKDQQTSTLREVANFQAFTQNKVKMQLRRQWRQQPISWISDLTRIVQLIDIYVLSVHWF